MLFCIEENLYKYKTHGIHVKNVILICLLNYHALLLHLYSSVEPESFPWGQQCKQNS